MNRPSPASPERRARAAVATTFALLVLTMALALAFGAEPIDLRRALSDPTSLDWIIVVDARLPRVLLGAVAGAGLSIVGVAFQAILRNPLAEPYVLGVSGGAAFGATLALVLGLGGAGILGASMIPVAAFAGGLASTALVYALAQKTHAASGPSILLAGIVVNAIASSAITFLKTLVSATKAQEILFWLVGFLDVPSVASVAFVALYVAIGSLVLLVDAGRLNLLALGNEAAGHLGVDARALERRTFFAASFIVGAVVSTTGLIGFVGLLVPHALRRIYGPDVRVLLPASLFAGASTLVACDLASRVGFRFLHTEPPVGSVTALLGGPLFLALLTKRRPGDRPGVA